MAFRRRSAPECLVRSLAIRLNLELARGKNPHPLGLAAPAGAAENGVGFYLLGGRGPMAGYIPPPGVYIQNDIEIAIGAEVFGIGDGAGAGPCRRPSPRCARDERRCCAH